MATIHVRNLEKIFAYWQENYLSMMLAIQNSTEIETKEVVHNDHNIWHQFFNLETISFDLRMNV